MKVLLLAFLLVSGWINAQTISGYVYDEQENKPLEGAFVYIDGTTFSASTDARGYFKITTPQKYNAPLVISYVGFETLTIDDPYKYTKPFKVMLREDAIMLNEVVISKGGPFTRKQMLKAFREQFLGTSRAGASCTIENEDDINLHYNTATNTLEVRVFEPIRIVNKRLQYRMSFDLASFEVAYYTKSLANIDIKRSFFAGTTFFTDISKNGAADKKRKETYVGSTVHLMRTIAARSWQQEKFQLYADRFPVDHNAYFNVSDSLTFKKVALKDIPDSTKRNRQAVQSGLANKKNGGKYADVKFSILHNGKDQSAITFNNGYFYIDENGLFFPITELSFGGYMAALKAGDLLPADYTYTP